MIKKRKTRKKAKVAPIKKLSKDFCGECELR